MRKLWNRLPRGLWLALDLLAILILLVCVWAMLGYPLWSTEAAFRCSLEDVGYPALDPELQVDTEFGLQCAAFDGSFVYRSTLQRESFGWRGTYQERCPQAEGIPYIRLHEARSFYTYDGYDYDMERDVLVPRTLPLFAVKAEQAAEASLRLIIGDGFTPRYEPYDPDDSAALIRGESFQLQCLETKNGWFVFGVNLAVMEQHLTPTIPEHEMRNWYDNYDPPYDSLALWLAWYSPDAYWDNMEPESRLELTLFDEMGQEIRTLELPTHYNH